MTELTAATAGDRRTRKQGEASVRTKACTVSSFSFSPCIYFQDYGLLSISPFNPSFSNSPPFAAFPLGDDLPRTPTAGPSRLHVLQDESEDTDATPRLTVSSSLPSVYAVTEDTPAARLRALLAQVPNTSSTSRTQLLHEPPPSLPKIANLTSSHLHDGPIHRQTRARLAKASGVCLPMLFATLEIRHGRMPGGIPST